MKVLTSKGVANHTEPKPWGHVRKGITQASAGEDVGQPLNSVKYLNEDAVPVEPRASNTWSDVKASYFRILRGRRNCTHIETSYTQAGRSRGRPWRDRIRVRVENPEGAMQR